jgi:putative acetyltransferase
VAPPRASEQDASVQCDIRPETPEDHAAIYQVVRAAFSEHEGVAELVDLIRESPGFVPELSLVACRQGEVVGHVMLSRAELVDELGERHKVLVLSPLAVSPGVQGRGIGSALVPAGLAGAEALAEPLVVLQGSPHYYPRFGFRDSRTLGITMDLPDWAPREAGMAYTLTAYEPSIRGHLIDPPPFATI